MGVQLCLEKGRVGDGDTRVMNETARTPKYGPRSPAPAVCPYHATCWAVHRVSCRGGTGQVLYMDAPGQAPRRRAGAGVHELSYLPVCW